MHYAVLGADARPLSRQDLSYAKALASTTLLDMQTVLKSPALFTTNTAALISDKYALLIDVNKKLAAVKDSEPFKTLTAQTIESGILKSFIDTVTEVAKIEPEISKLQVVQEPQSSAPPAPYNGFKPVPFMSAPAASPGMAMGPSEELTKKLLRPVTTFVNLPAGYTPGKSVWVSGSTNAPVATGAGVSAPLILAGIAALALTLK